MSRACSSVVGDSARIGSNKLEQGSTSALELSARRPVYTLEYTRVSWLPGNTNSQFLNRAPPRGHHHIPSHPSSNRRFLPHSNDFYPPKSILLSSVTSTLADISGKSSVGKLRMPSQARGITQDLCKQPSGRQGRPPAAGFY